MTIIAPPSTHKICSKITLPAHPKFLMNKLLATGLPLVALTIAHPATSFASSSDNGFQVTDSISYDLDEIVVTATRAPRTLKAAPVQTRLISSKDINLADASDIEDLLRQEMPGIEFSYAMNQQTHLNFNGLGGQSVLFLVDGERLAGESMDDVDFSRIDMTDVDHIEIVKGASSALYGSNAGGGVVNIITRKASSPWHAAASARIGRHSNQRYSISLVAKGSHVRNEFSGYRSSVDNYDVHSAPNPVTRVVSTIYGNSVWNVRNRFTATLSDNLSLSARVGFFFRQLARSEDSPERYRDYSAGLRADWMIDDADRLELSYSFDQYDKSDFYRISGLDVRDYSNVQNAARGLFTHTFDGGSAFLVGFDYMHDFMRNTRLSTPEHTQDSYDVFCQYDWIVNRKWELVGALRYDYFSDGRVSRITPKINACFRPRYDLALRVGYGMGFRAPSMKEKYYQFDMAGIWIVNGNPLLKPEESHNVTFSAEYNHGNYSAVVSAYYNNIHDRITTGMPYYRPDDATQLYMDYENLSRYSVWGGEVNLNARWSIGFSARIVYALTLEHSPSDRDGNTVASQYIPARRHSVTARFCWEKRFSKFYALNVVLSGRTLSGVKNVEYRNYYDISEGTVEVNYPPYTIWKFSMVHSLSRHVKVSLAVDNLLNYKPRYYYLNCPLTDGADFMAGIEVDI